jgi:hypothetical protein
VPKPQAFGCIFVPYRQAVNLALVSCPKLQILDDMDRKDLCINWLLLLELSVDFLPKLACFIKFAHFDIFLPTELIKWLLPFFRTVHFQELHKLADYPPLNFLLSLPSFNNNFCCFIGKRNYFDLSFESSRRVFNNLFFFFF